MRRRDWLLAFLAVEPAGGWQWRDGSTYWIDPVRVVKGLFLAQHQDVDETIVPLSFQPYHFYPYAYGPFSSEVYADLDRLHEAGLVERQDVPGKTYARWRLTPEGQNVASHVLAELEPHAVARLRAAKRCVVFTAFSSLLRYVYGRFPSYATSSVMSFARQ
jgi:hypothetical protein